MSSTTSHKFNSNKQNYGCQINFKIFTDELPETSDHKNMVAKNESGSQQETDYQNDALAS